MAFEKKPAIGFYDTAEENQRSKEAGEEFRPQTLEQLEGKRRAVSVQLHLVRAIVPCPPVYLLDYCLIDHINQAALRQLHALLHAEPLPFLHVSKAVTPAFRCASAYRLGTASCLHGKILQASL